MSKIHLLSEHVCNKIAAGEVVERPASVVKELLENALDAGAGKISVSVERAGRRLIAVRDNGEGMDPDDALLCLESHATSKIRDDADIFNISSFGFRGEALPSIAAVSRMTIRTRRKDSQEGTEVSVSAGKFIENKPVGCAPGTEITVRDLFYNLPARQKFMRSEATEERHILECVTNISLSHADVAFELKIDGRTVISSPSSSRGDARIRDLFGKSFADAMLPVSRTEYGILVEGFVSKRSFTRNSRSDQRIFVNGRCIEAQAVYRGIREGYGPMIESGRYPAAILYLTLPPAEVDVNVHPAKREVRFRHEFEVTAAVRTAVLQALRAGDAVLPAPAAAGQGAETPLPMPSPRTSLYPDFVPRNTSAAPARGPVTLPSILQSSLVTYSPARGALFRPPEPAENDAADATPLLPLSPPAEERPSSAEQAEPVSAPARKTPSDMKLLGVLENSYLVGVIPGGLVLIDQHAAHERVLFEQLLHGIHGVCSQKLLIPITLEVSRSDMLFVTRNRESFEKIGYDAEPFGQNTLKLNAIPAAVPQENAGGMFQDILSRLAEDAPAQKNPVGRIAQAACKAAVKAHDVLTMEECQALLEQLAACELPYSCPHGRPTILNISLSEIERRFGRK